MRPAAVNRLKTSRSLPRVTSLALPQMADCFKSGSLSTLMLVLSMASSTGSTLQAQSLDTPMTRLRPISQPSAVERYLPRETQHTAPPPQSPVVNADWQSLPWRPSRAANATWEGSNQHVARMQFQLPSGGGISTTAPPATSSDASMVPPPVLGPEMSPTGPRTMAPTSPMTPTSPGPMTMGPTTMGPTTMGPTTNLPAATPRSLPMAPGTTAAPLTMTPSVPSSSDLTPLAAPQLNDQFATLDNCSCISPPGSYVAATGWTQCAPSPTSFVATPASTTYVAPATTVAPATIAGPPVIPDASTMPRGSGVPRHPLISFGQNRNPIVVGQGILGQPVAYVPGQPVRNWIRYLFP